MILEAAIYAILAAAAGVTTIVGARIYPNLMPEGAAYPALTYFTVSADEEHTLDRASGLVHQRIQVDAWGNDYTTVKTLMKQVRSALEAAYGIVQTPLGNLDINGILRDNERDLYEDKTRTHHCAGDFLVLYNE